LVDESERRPAPSSQARTVGAVKCFLRFCVENEYLDRDPAAVLRTPKKREALPELVRRPGHGGLTLSRDRGADEYGTREPVPGITPRPLPEG
jgi:site-specific recombinase XerD